MDEDPAIKEKILTYEVHPTRSFPGDGLPTKPEHPDKPGR